MSSFSWAAVSAVFLLLACVPVMTTAKEASQGDFYRVPLASGEVDGYWWGVGASGQKGKSLKKVCQSVAVVPVVEPGEDVETHQSKLCGALPTPADSISMSVVLGSSDDATTLLATIYRPIVHRVVFTLGTGEQTSHRTRTVNAAKRAKEDIHLFRYLAVTFKGGNCIRRVTTYDRQGSVIEREKAEPGCG